MSIGSIPDDILQIILEKVDIYTTLTSLPLVCTRFAKILSDKNPRRPFKWGIRKRPILKSDYAFDLLPIVNDELILNNIIHVTHIYAEEMNLDNHTYCLFGEGDNIKGHVKKMHTMPRQSEPNIFHSQIPNVAERKVKYFIFMGVISSYHNIPIIDLNLGVFFYTSDSLREILRAIHSYQRHNIALKLFFNTKFQKKDSFYYINKLLTTPITSIQH